MTKQQTITPDIASAVILQIPLETLSISDLNPRKTVSEAHIESLADSIERFGLIHNLAGLMDADGNVGVVAGGCRLRALQLIAQRSEDHPFATVPVKLASSATEAGDWANAENAAREDMTPADEIRAFGRMKARNATVPEIALAFAVTEARVYQRLAPPPDRRSPRGSIACALLESVVTISGRKQKCYFWFFDGLVVI